MRKLALIMVLMAPVTHAEVYRCEVDGVKKYMSRPCEGAIKSEKVEIYIPPADPLQGAINSKRIMIGMTKRQVKESWGQPRDINRRVSKYGTTEQWVYGDFLKNRQYVYFENGLVTSISN